nr:unnamed protein product [Digitaria exilis]
MLTLVLSAMLTKSTALAKVPWIEVSRSRSLILSLEVKAFVVALTIGVYVYLLTLS